MPGNTPSTPPQLDQIVAPLHPRNIAHLTLATIATPIDPAIDLLTCIGILGHLPEPQARQAIHHISHVPRLLFAEPLTPLARYAKPTRWWLHRLAEAGLHPDWRFDATAIAPDAFLATRTAATDPDLFADFLHHRTTAQTQGARATALALALADSETTRHRLTAELAATRRERDLIRASTTWRATAPLRRLLTPIRRTATPIPIPPPEPLPTPTVATPQHLPPIDIILPLAAITDPRAIPAALNQLSPGASLILIETGTIPDPIIQLVQTIPDPRLKLLRPMTHDGVSPTLATALAATTTPHILLTTPATILAPTALRRLAAELATHPGADLIYADEDRIDPTGSPGDPFHKPAWSLDLALEQDLVGALCLFSRTLLLPLRPEPLAPDDTPLQDLALLAAPKHIRHIPAILAHRTTPRPRAPTPPAVERALAALPPCRCHPILTPSVFDPARHRIRWTLPTPEPRVSIIVPTRDHPDLLARCTEGLVHRTDYQNLELLIADNDSTDPATLALLDHLRLTPRVRILPSPGPFNYSAINNAAAAQATGDILLLLNNDIDVIRPNWLREMAGHALRPDIGAVGCRLLFPGGRIQHAGIVGGVGRFDNGPGVAGHFGLAADPLDPGHGDQFILTREVLAVTAACLALRRDVFLAAGGFDATHLPIALNDLDLCLRLRTHGYRILWTPFAELHHLESASRGSDTTPPPDAGPTPAAAARFHQECRVIRDRWGPTLDSDPFYNPAFSRADHSFQLAR